MMIFILPVKIFAQAPDNYKWVQHMNGLTAAGTYIIDIAVDPTDSNILYTDIMKFGMYKSTNAGVSWSSINTGLPAFTETQSMNVSKQGRIVFDPNNTSIIYLNADGKIFKTINGGTSWTDISAGTETSSYSNPSLKKFSIFCMAPDPVTSNVLYAATLSSGYTGGLFKTINAGASWTQIGGMISSNTGSALGYSSNDSCPFTIDKNNTQNIYVTTHVNVNYKSTDGGNTWTTMAYFPSYPSNIDVYILTKNSGNNVLFAGTNHGTYKSSDNGASWQVPTGLTGKNAIMIKFSPLDPTIGYAISQGEFFKTVNSGSAWTRPFSDIDNSFTNLEVDAITTTKVYVSTNYGLIKKSVSAGSSFSSISSGLPSDKTFDQFTSFKQSKSDPNIVYFSAKTKIFKSTDAGRTWILLGTLPSGVAFAENIAIDPTNPNIVVFADYSPTNNSLLRPMTLWRSTDGAQTWTQVYSKLPIIDASDRFIDIKFSISDHNRLYARTLNGGTNSFIVSSDNGQTWTPYSTPFEADFGGFQMLQVDSTNKDIVYVFPESDLPYKSINGGTSWTQLTFTQNLTGVTSYGTTGAAINPINNNIYVGYQYYDNLFNVLRIQYLKSIDGGATFQNISSLETLEDQTDPNIFFYIDYAGNNIIASNTSDLIHSTDAGATWSSFPLTGIPNGFASVLYYALPSTVSNGDMLARFRSFSTNIYYFYRYENNIPLFDQSVLSSNNNANNSQIYHVNDNALISYVIKNTGSAGGTNLVATIILPADKLILSQTSTITVDGNPVSGYTLNGNILTINLPDLDYQKQYTLQFHVNVLTTGAITLIPKINSTEDVLGTSTSAVTINASNVPTLVDTGVNAIVEIIYGGWILIVLILIKFFSRKQLLIKINRGSL